MKKNMILVVGVLVVILLGAFFVNLNSSKSQKASIVDTEDSVSEMNESKEQEMMEKEKGESMMDKGDDKMMESESGRYVEYSKVALNAAKERRVLFFYASWCPTCKPTDASLKANLDKIPEDLTVIRVNYNDSDTDDQEKDLAKKYGITYQHTFVQIDASGKEITKWNGGKIDELLANIK